MFRFDHFNFNVFDLEKNEKTKEITKQFNINGKSYKI